MVSYSVRLAAFEKIDNLLFKVLVTRVNSDSASYKTSLQILV
jgi:hypothetical protein